MRNLIFHLPEYCGKIIIESEASIDYIDTEKSVEEFKEVLKGNLPCGMYPEFVKSVVKEELEKVCDVETLEIFKDAINKNGYTKGHELYLILKRIIIEKGREE